MSTLGAIITEAIVDHYGRDAFLERLSHPFWFQSFGAVMGMDWHSSGITTSVIGAGSDNFPAGSNSSTRFFEIYRFQSCGSSAPRRARIASSRFENNNTAG